MAGKAHHKYTPSFVIVFLFILALRGNPLSTPSNQKHNEDHQSKCRFYQKFFTYLADQTEASADQFYPDLHVLSEQGNPLAIYYLSVSMFSSLKDEKRQNQVDGLGHSDFFLSNCVRVLGLCLKSLEVNPEQTAYMIADLLTTKEIHIYLEMPVFECRRLAYDWLVVAGSFGNADALFLLAEFYFDELVKIVVNGGFLGDASFVECLQRHDIFNFVEPESKGLLGFLKRGDPEPSQDMTLTTIQEKYRHLPYQTTSSIFSSRFSLFPL